MLRFRGKWVEEWNELNRGKITLDMVIGKKKDVYRFIHYDKFFGDLIEKQIDKEMLNKLSLLPISNLALIMGVMNK